MSDPDEKDTDESTVDDYRVPVDPAEQSQCEACQ